MSTKTAIILSSFGGPRNVDEIGPFLTELLTDENVIRLPFVPRFFERWFFKKVALKRVPKIAKDYELIGGKSPLFEDIERLAQQLRERTCLPVVTFHRYLPATHAPFLSDIRSIRAERLIVIPMYPQFSYTTTGSVARFFQDHLSEEMVQKMVWIKSYATDSLYIQAMQNCIRDFLAASGLNEKGVFLFFSAHGLPQKYVDQGDPYEHECQQTYNAVMKAFPESPSLLAFQSKFGPGAWLRPYTSELSKRPLSWNQGKEHVVFVPLSFTSDHLETLYEIEHIYLPSIRASGLAAHRCPALNLRADWIEALVSILRTGIQWCHGHQRRLGAGDEIPCRDRKVPR
jgi:ferrochelatase